MLLWLCVATQVAAPKAGVYVCVKLCWLSRDGGRRRQAGTCSRGVTQAEKSQSRISTRASSPHDMCQACIGAVACTANRASEASHLPVPRRHIPASYVSELWLCGGRAAGPRLTYDFWKGGNLCGPRGTQLAGCHRVLAPWRTAGSSSGGGSGRPAAEPPSCSCCGAEP